jgi:hypothetical protein
MHICQQLLSQRACLLIDILLRRRIRPAHKNAQQNQREQAPFALVTGPSPGPCDVFLRNMNKLHN